MFLSGYAAGRPEALLFSSTHPACPSLLVSLRAIDSALLAKGPLSRLASGKPSAYVCWEGKSTSPCQLVSLPFLIPPASATVPPQWEGGALRPTLPSSSGDSLHDSLSTSQLLGLFPSTRKLCLTCDPWKVHSYPEYHPTSSPPPRCPTPTSLAEEPAPPHNLRLMVTSHRFCP